MKVASNEFGIHAAALEAAAHVTHQLRTGMGAPSSHGVGLDILVHHLVRVQLRAVAWQEEQAYPSRVVFQPLAHFFAAMNGMPVHNDENLAFGLFH